MISSRTVVLALLIVVGALVLVDVVLRPLLRTMPAVSPVFSTAIVAALLAYLVGSILFANGARLFRVRPPRPRIRSVPRKHSAEDFINEFERRNRR